jgi:hypothetical protein
MTDHEHRGSDDGFRRPNMEAFIRNLAASARMAAESFAEAMSRASERQNQTQPEETDTDKELEAEIMSRLKRMDAEIDRLEANADRMLAAL